MKKEKDNLVNEIEFKPEMNFIMDKLWKFNN